MNNYEDIINLEYKKNKSRKQMSMDDRAAQFASFAALTGYNDEISETSRTTDNKIILDENIKYQLDLKIQEIYKIINSKPTIKITYFVPDNLKAGGSYKTVINCINKIDLNNRLIIMKNDINIPISNIINLEILDNQNH